MERLSEKVRELETNPWDKFEDHYKTVDILKTTLEKMNKKYKELSDKYKAAVEASK